MKPKYLKDFTQEELIKIINENKRKEKKEKEELRRQRNELLLKNFLLKNKINKSKSKAKAKSKQELKPKYFKDFTQEEIIKIINENKRKEKKDKEKFRKQRNELLLKNLLLENKKTKKSKSKSKSKPKSFQDYYQECIKGKDIPEDTPEFLKKPLLKAKKLYEKGIILEKSTLANFAEMYVIEGVPVLLPLEYFKIKAPQIKDFLRKYPKTKVRMLLVCLMQKDINFGNMSGLIYRQTDNAYFQSDTHINAENTNVKVILKDMIKEIMARLAMYQENGSDWYFKEVVRLENHIVEYKPIKGGTYIPLPEFVKKKNAIINIKNEDNKCFLWSVLRCLHPKEVHGERLCDLKKYENELNFKEIKFPVKVKGITKFEKLNPFLPKINVFPINDNNKVYPLIVNQKKSKKNRKNDCKKTIDLFFHSDGEKQHYSLIKNFSRLVRSQITKDTTRKIYICKKCFYHFTKEDLLEKHIEYCGNNETAVVKMPTKEKSIPKFKHHFKKLPLPFIIYADFECFTIPVNSCQPNPEKSYTKTYQKHEPSGFCLYLKSLDGMNTNFKPIVYTKKNSDEDISKKFIKHVVKLTHRIYKDYYKKPKPYNLSDKEEKEFQSASICHICEEEFTRDKKSKDNFKVRDHCHFTGNFRGAAHNICNLSCRKPLNLPVIFHNLQGYDAHLFIKQLLTSIPSTEEKYISFSKFIAVDQYYSKKHEKVLFKKFEIRFIDSFKFLQTSLANLVSNLQPSDFSNLQKNIKNNSSLLARKGVYPYDYVISIEKLKETKLPPKEAFYSKLLNEEISDEDYHHAHNVWNTFSCQTIQDYHNLYLKTDVLLLADVFENLRKTCLKYYKLDPCHYYTAPGLAWDACLKLTKQELQLLTDYDMLMMFEKGIRGGISHISKRYAEANNKYMKDFDKTKPSTYIQYLDANNLYGWAMSQKLPTHWC